MPVSSTFMFVAALDPDRRAALCGLLASLNSRPGFADPDNSEVPFGRLPQLHFARFVILDDDTAVDNAPYGVDTTPAPSRLAFLGDVDGSRSAFVSDLVRVAGPGLTRIFGHCRDFEASVPLERWLLEHNVEPAVNYANWPGRRVQQIREEAALRVALVGYLKEEAHVQVSPSELHKRLRARVLRDGPSLTDPPRVSFAEWFGEATHFVGSAALILVALPFALLAAPFYLVVLRYREKTDASASTRPTALHLRELGILEDVDVTNQFSAFGNVKPGRFRLWTLFVVFWIVGLSTRHFYVKGRLARVGSIHFARWVFLDDHKRLFFGSNYDGSLEAYMDDFVNKVAFGLNLVFSNGIGYPRTRFLALDGAKDEQAFKYYIRRHQLPTEVWYKAYPGLTAADIARNARIRQGLKTGEMSDTLARQWLAEL